MQKICFTLLSIILMILIQTTSAAAYEMEMEQLSNTIAKQISKSSRKHLQRVAVVDFTDLQGNVTELGRFIAEELSINLARSEKQFEVIDRTHLKSLLEEHKFSMSGLVDPQTAKKLGKIAGVDAIVTGKLTPFGDNVRVSCTVISTATAKTLAAGKTSIAKTRTIEQLLAGSVNQTGLAERDQEQDMAERQRRARDAEREKLDRENAAMDRLKEEQKKLDAERRRLEEEKLKQEKSAKDSEQLEKIQEEQRRLEAERLRIEAERKQLTESAKKPAPPPIKRGYKPIATQAAGDFIFDLIDMRISGDEITVTVEVINRSDSATTYIAFYDESHRWTKSKITDDTDKTIEVTKVFFWKGDQKTTMYDVGTRGISVDPKSTVTAQLVFKKVRAGIKTLKSFILHPFIYNRVAFVWRWTEADLTFDNIRLIRGK